MCSGLGISRSSSIQAPPGHSILSPAAYLFETQASRSSRTSVTICALAGAASECRNVLTDWGANSRTSKASFASSGESRHNLDSVSAVQRAPAKGQQLPYRQGSSCATPPSPSGLSFSRFGPRPAQGLICGRSCSGAAFVRPHVARASG